MPLLQSEMMWVRVCVCAYWGSCQHGRERVALEPARPPTRAPLHSGSGAWGWCQPNRRGRTNLREARETRQEAFDDTSRQLLSEKISSHQAGPVPVGDNQDSETFGNLRRVRPRVSSVYNVQLREEKKKKKEKRPHQTSREGLARGSNICVLFLMRHLSKPMPIKSHDAARESGRALTQLARWTGRCFHS